MTVASVRAALLPQDARLPGLDAAFSDEIMEILARDVVQRGYELASCRASYLRYKPEQSCLVLYRVELCDDRGRIRDHLVHLRFYTADRCDRVWTRGRIQRAAAHAQPMPLRAIAHIPSLAAIAQAFPVDVDMPALVRLRAERPLRYKPARKALLFCGARFAKVYADDRGARAFAAGRALAAAGAPVVEPAAYDPQLRALVHPAIPGLSLSALRGTTEYGAVAAEVGRALARVHAVPIDGLEQHDWHRDLAGAATAVGVARPDLASAATRIARDAGALLDAPPRQVVIHGDFYDDQVVTGSAGPVLLDFDRVALGDPLVDVGTFVARLRAEGEEDVAAGFVESYTAVARGVVDRRRLAATEAAALLKIAAEPFRALAPGWSEEVEQRLELAEAQLRTARRSVVSVPRDPELGGLERLLDRRRADAVLSDVLGRPVEVTEATVVRYRPGRRATVRYRLRSGTIYAKTYASDRAPRVHRTLSRLVSAPVEGVMLPEPLGVGDSQHLVVLGEVAGEPVTTRLVGGDVALARTLASRLHALHSCGAWLERQHTPEDELVAAQRRLENLPGHLRQRAYRSLTSAAEVIRARPWRYRPVHRDFYPDQVLADGEAIGFLDLDDAAMSEPAVDIANFLAHLRLLALERPHDGTELEGVAQAFLREASGADVELDLTLVRALEATTLTRLACIHVAKGKTLAGQLLQSAGADE